MKVEVFFKGGNRAMLEADKTIMETDGRGKAESIATLVANGYNVINWQNVCFVRAVKEEGEED